MWLVQFVWARKSSVFTLTASASARARNEKFKKETVMFTKTLNIGGQNRTVEFPDKCPICHHYADIMHKSTYKLPGNGGARIVFQCPMANCQEIFIGKYHHAPAKQGLISLVPHRIEGMIISEEIEKISPTFCSIFDEAHQAQVMGLTQITGPGYRKALEFLIKDYAKIKNGEKEKKIDGMLLGNVIANYIDNPRIKAMSKRATWLGNDETHYIRKWEEHDIEDLIKLIDITVKWIELEALSDKYEENMQAGK